MKKYFLAFVAIFTLVTNSFSQTNIEGVEEIDSKNIGYIQHEKKPIGYYIFYKDSKVDKSNELNKLKMYDLNFKETKTIEIQTPKGSRLSEVAFNSKTFLLNFGTMGFLSYDVNGNKTGEIYFDDLSLANRAAFNAHTSERSVATIFPLGEEGFVKYSAQSNLKMGMALGMGMGMAMGGKNKNVYFTLKGYSNSLKEIFTYDASGDAEIISGEVNFSNEKFIGVTVSKSGKGVKGKQEVNFILLNSKTGKVIFETSISDKEDYQSIINASYNSDENGFMLVGEYVDKENEVSMAKITGLVFTSLNADGKIIQKKKLAYSTQLSKIKSILGEEKGGVYFHNFTLNEGRWTGIGELYTKSSSTVISKELIVLEFNNKFDLISVESFKKEETKTKTIGGSTTAPELVALNAFDFRYLQQSDGGNSYTIVYRTMVEENNKVVKNQMNIGSIYYNGSVFKTSKKLHMGQGEILQLTPGEEGNTIVWDYLKKEKVVRVTSVQTSE